MKISHKLVASFVGVSLLRIVVGAIAIADNGCAIPETVRSRIFDPFFTTKPIGKSTAMGLSISYKIVIEKNRGKIWCDST
ncbi:ATP-binding protein [Nostoc sp. DSM 114159]|jgi:signal transduction histidine kinase